MTTDIDELLIEWYRKALESQKRYPDMLSIVGFNSGCISTIKDVWLALHDGEEMSNELEDKIRSEI